MKDLFTCEKRICFKMAAIALISTETNANLLYAILQKLQIQKQRNYYSH